MSLNVYSKLESQFTSPELFELYEKLKKQEIELKNPVEISNFGKLSSKKKNKDELSTIREEHGYEEEMTRSSDRDLSRRSAKTINDSFKTVKSEYRQESRPSVISRNSIVILVDNVERNLNNAFTMNVMKLFHPVVNIEQFLDPDGKFRLQRKDEMEFHETLFCFLTSNELFDPENAFQILRILMDPEIVRKAQLIDCITSYSNEYMNNIKSISEIRILVNAFKKLNENRLTFNRPNSEFSSNKSTISTTSAKSTKLSKKTEILAYENTKKYLNLHEKMIQEMSEDKENNFIQIPNQINNRSDLMYFRSHVIGAKKLIDKKEREEEELEKCTFNPKINPSYSNTDEDHSISRLYRYKSNREKDEIAKKAILEKEIEELKKCTFKPKIGKSMPDLTQKGKTNIKGFEKFVEKTRMANLKEELKKESLNHVPNGENYEKLRKLKQKPFNLRVDNLKRERELPFVVIDLNIGSGRFKRIKIRGARIPLYEKENPKRISINYGKIFNLDQDSTEKLYELIEEQFEIFNKANNSNY